MRRRRLSHAAWPAVLAILVGASRAQLLSGLGNLLGLSGGSQMPIQGTQPYPSYGVSSPQYGMPSGISGYGGYGQPAAQSGQYGVPASQSTGRQVNLDISLPNVQIHQPDTQAELRLSLPAVEREQQPSPAASPFTLNASQAPLMPAGPPVGTAPGTASGPLSTPFGSRSPPSGGTGQAGYQPARGINPFSAPGPASALPGSGSLLPPHGASAFAPQPSSPRAIPGSSGPLASGSPSSSASGSPSPFAFGSPNSLAPGAPNSFASGSSGPFTPGAPSPFASGSPSSFASGSPNALAPGVPNSFAPGPFASGFPNSLTPGTPSLPSPGFSPSPTSAALPGSTGFAPGLPMPLSQFPGQASARPGVSPLAQPPPSFRLPFNVPASGLPLNAPPGRRDKSHEPVEKRVAYLEYLANVYIQGEDLAQARQTLQEMYQWLVKAPSMRGPLSRAIQSTQQKIDQRMDCILRKCNSTDCRRDAQVTGHQDDQSDLLRSFGDNFDLIIDNMPLLPSSSGTISEAQQKQIVSRIHMLLSRGLMAPAMAIFGQAISHPLLTAGEALRKLAVALKILRYDLENPGSCMPLWTDDCSVDWQRKGEILDAVEDLRNPLVSINQRRFKSFPKDTIARILTAAGRAEVWDSLAGLRHKGDIYMAKACLALRGVPSPLGGTPSSPQEGRLLAKQYYSQCVQDGGLTRAQTTGCTEGLSQIISLERTCPFDGYVRISQQPQVLSDYLFVKCQIPHRPSYSHPSSAKGPRSWPHGQHGLAKKCNARLQIKKLGMVARLLDQLRDQLDEVKPMHCEAHHRLKQLKRHHQRWAKTQKSMTEGLSQWTARLRDYLDKLQQSLPPPPPRRPRPKKNKRTILASLQGALNELANMQAQ